MDKLTKLALAPFSSVTRIAMANVSKPLIFISYSHLDEDWLDYARGHLETAAYGFEIWDDRRMVGGARWEKRNRQGAFGLSRLHTPSLASLLKL
jgi:hypothetical protein